MGITIKPHKTLPVAVIPAAPTVDELIARIEANFAAISPAEYITELEVFATPCNDDFWA